MSKICTKCEENKSVDKFWKDSTKKDGYYSSCKDCNRELNRKYQRKRYAEDEEYREYQRQWRKDNKEEIKEYSRKWYQENKERLKPIRKKWREENKERLKKQKKKYRQENKEKINKYFREKREDPEFRLLMNLRYRVGDFILGTNRSKTTKQLLGCGWKMFVKRFEDQFEEGMTWDNYGDWHVDHIIPCTAFDLTNKYAQAVCFHYSNLQPLWAEDNISKGNDIPDFGIEIDKEFLQQRGCR